MGIHYVARVRCGLWDRQHKSISSLACIKESFGILGLGPRVREGLYEAIRKGKSISGHV